MDGQPEVLSISSTLLKYVVHISLIYIYIYVNSSHMHCTKTS